MNKKILLAIAAALVTLALALAACSDKAADTNGDGLLPSGTTTEFTGCKTFNMLSSRTAIPPDRDCIEYEYDGQSVLRLTHINAGFNCCPDSLSASFHTVGGSITIHETEWLTNPCHCLCLFDLVYEIAYVSPGQYSIRVNEPYIQDGDEELEFTVDLVASPSGQVCVDRDHYPWREE